ncbi:MAG: NAD-dependent epimerase/dehydratase family protein [Ignavibacteriales bacterium]|nr:NAD-dependent epimerase/dehydratase family protein [Ignavibacteriales bacterium]
MILVTGNVGFIGTYLTKALVKQGFKVHGIDLRPLRDSEDVVNHVQGNILEKDSVRKAMEGADCIIHLAAEHKDFGVDRDQYYRVNVDGTKMLLRTASEMKINKFVFFSSVAVYGASQPSSDGTLPNPNNDYGASKLKTEDAVRVWAAEDPAREVVILRPTVVFGPRNRANIFRLVRQVCDKQFIWVGKGDNIKSVAYVENLVDATILLLNTMAPGVLTLNYSDRPQLTTKEIVDIIAQKAGVTVPSRRIPLPLALSVARVFDLLGNITRRDFPITSARIRKFNTPTCHNAEKIFAMGFQPRYSIEEGFEKNVRWYLSNKGDLDLSDTLD